MDLKRASRRLALPALTVASAWLFARAAASLVVEIRPPLPPINAVRARAERAARAEDSAVSFASVRRRNLMNVALEPPPGLRRDSRKQSGQLTPEEQAALAAAMNRLPVSTLGWELCGTVVDTADPRECRAVLLIDKQQAAYAPGSEIRGWKLLLIDRRTIVLEKDGKRERLLVGKDRGDLAGTADGGKPAVALDRAAIEAQMRDLPGLMKQASLAPATVDGVQGLSVTRLKPDGLFARLGLQPGDLLIEANGRPLASFADLAGLPAMLAGDSLRLEVLRKGRRTVLTCNISG